MEETQRLDAIQTGENPRCRRSSKEKETQPYEAKWQADKACYGTRVNLGLAFTRFRALEENLGMKSDAELACFLLDRKVPNTHG